MRLTKAQIGLLILILLLAFALRVWDLGARSLWLDEGLEYRVATSPVTTLLQTVRKKIQDPPLFSILLHVWMNLGESEVHLRFLSVCFSMLSTLGIARLGYKLFGPSTGLLGALIMALLPAEIRYAQDVGQYALMECMLVWNLIALERVTRCRTWSAYGSWALLAVAGTYSYYGTVLTLLVPFGYIVMGDILERNRQVRKDCAALLLYGICLLPLAYFFPSQLFRGPTSQAFQANLVSPTQELEILWRSTKQLLIAFQLTGWPWTNVPDWLPSLLTISALALLYRPNQARKTKLLGQLVLTWGAYYLISRFGLFPYGYRYSLILTPLLVPAIAGGITSGLSQTWTRPISSALLLTLVGLCILSLPNRTFREWAYPHANWTWPETEDLRPVTQFWMTHREHTEPTYVYYGAVRAFQYYVHIYGQDGNIYNSKWIRNLSLEEKVASIQTTLGYNPRRFWIIFSHVYREEDELILDQLLKHYEIVLSHEETGASAYLLEQR